MTNRGSNSGWWMLAAACGAGLVAAARRGNRRSQRLDLNGARTLIVGGSRGLGLALAYELGDAGARVAIAARNSEELQKAKEDLAQHGIEAITLQADVSRAQDCGSLIQNAAEQLNGLDVLVNDAGRIRVGPFESVTEKDFHDAMDLMFWGPVRLSLAALPHLYRSERARIVNIASVGGRVSIPHLLPYSCAKFALVGFSTGLGTELAKKGVHVLTVIPGLMRTGSYLNAQFAGDTKKEFAWFGLLGNLPGMSVSAKHAAQRIAEAMRSGERVCNISLAAEVLIAVETLAPEINRRLLEIVNELLLPTSGATNAARGKSVNPTLNAVFQALTGLGRQAANALNE